MAETIQFSTFDLSGEYDVADSMTDMSIDRTGWVFAKNSSLCYDWYTRTRKFSRYIGVCFCCISALFNHCRHVRLSYVAALTNGG